MIWYSSSRDAGLLEQSNEKVFNERLRSFSEGDDPDLVFERHCTLGGGTTWTGFRSGFHRPDGSITPAFSSSSARIKDALEGYPILDEADYSVGNTWRRSTNYRSELWRETDLPEGWEAEVYSDFFDNCMDEFTENP